MKILSFFLLFCIFFQSSFASFTLKSAREAAQYLSNLGIITNQSENPELYRLSESISRAETMKIIAKLSGEEISTNCESSFSDVASDSWQCKYVMWALKKWYISQNTTFRPSDNITKTEAMKLILKVQNIEKTQNTDSWQKDYMMTAYQYGIIPEKYFDYDAFANRGWIFQIATVTLEQKSEIEILKQQIISDESL